jgi:hypothetical protein
VDVATSENATRGNWRSAYAICDDASSVLNFVKLACFFLLFLYPTSHIQKILEIFQHNQSEPRRENEESQSSAETRSNFFCLKLGFERKRIREWSPMNILRSSEKGHKLRETIRWIF